MLFVFVRQRAQTKEDNSTMMVISRQGRGWSGVLAMRVVGKAVTEVFFNSSGFFFGFCRERKKNDGTKIITVLLYAEATQSNARKKDKRNQVCVRGVVAQRTKPLQPAAGVFLFSRDFLEIVFFSVSSLSPSRACDRRRGFRLLIIPGVSIAVFIRLPLACSSSPVFWLVAKNW